MPSSRRLTVAIAIVLATPAAHACGEGIFSMGGSLRYGGYLAPQPAAVLVYEPDGNASQQRVALYRGLAGAGHRVTIVSDPSRLGEALAARRYDVVVVDHMHAHALEASTASPLRRLVVVAHRPARATQPGRMQVRESAGLGNWLGALNRLLKH